MDVKKEIKDYVTCHNCGSYDNVHVVTIGNRFCVIIKLCSKCMLKLSDQLTDVITSHNCDIAAEQIEEQGV